MSILNAEYGPARAVQSGIRKSFFTLSKRKARSDRARLGLVGAAQPTGAERRLASESKGELTLALNAEYGPARAVQSGIRKADAGFFNSIKKEGTPRIFHAQDRAIDDFTLKGRRQDSRNRSTQVDTCPI
jgi:hypothetical protein